VFHNLTRSSRLTITSAREFQRMARTKQQGAEVAVTIRDRKEEEERR
jgi:hypothetical protein